MAGNSSPDQGLRLGAGEAADLQAVLVDWFHGHARPLPWRAPGTTGWGVLVSEVMAQQTPVSRVAPVWTEWMRRWPKPSDLAAEPPGEAVRAWGRLGYPRRALRLHEAAVLLRDRHADEVPADLDLLAQLPGVGDYTAAAVACFGYGRRHVVLDVNVRRVLARAVAGNDGPTGTVSAAERRLAELLLPTGDAAAAVWSVAVMEFGALVCTARSPDCARCPIATHCAWLRGGATPAARPRRTQTWIGTDRQARGRVLAVLRAADGPVPGGDLLAGLADWPDPAQVHRAVAGLVEDGLLEERDGLFALPGEAR